MKKVLDYLIRDQLFIDNHRPKWLYGLEIDRYYPELRLGFEYQGSQHSYWVPKYHKGPDDWEKQWRYDEEKKFRCKNKRVFLVRVYPWQLTIGGVIEQIKRKKRRKWEDWRIREIGTGYRKSDPDAIAINKLCREYQNIVKSNFESGKWTRFRMNPPRQRNKERSQNNVNSRRRKHPKPKRWPNDFFITREELRRMRSGNE